MLWWYSTGRHYCVCTKGPLNGSAAGFDLALAVSGGRQLGSSRRAVGGWLLPVVLSPSLNTAKSQKSDVCASTSYSVDASPCIVRLSVGVYVLGLAGLCRSK